MILPFIELMSNKSALKELTSLLPVSGEIADKFSSEKIISKIEKF